MSRLASLSCCFVLLALSFGSLSLAARAAPTPPDGPRLSSEGMLDQLRAATAGRVRIARHAETGQLRFIGTDPQSSIPHPSSIGSTASPEQAAQAFLGAYGALFGLRDPARELATMRAATLGDRSFVRFQQVYQGIPVLGGELIVQLDGRRNMLSASGEILPDLRLRVAPALTGSVAADQALATIAASYGLRPADLRASAAQLWLYNPALLGGPGPRRTALTWRTEVTGSAPDGTPIRELALVDAQSGVVVLHFDQIAAGKQRHICDANNVVDLDGNPDNNCRPADRDRNEGQPATGIADVDQAYDYSGDTYDYYFNNFGRDSLDGQGLPLISLVKYCPSFFECPYANAFWDGRQMTYGEGFAAADDVVGHELTHGFTEFTSHLFYYYQSGAINESLSDVFGELIDQTNGKGTDTSAVRWQIGEDLPSGTIRNMRNPTSLGDPDRTGSPLYRGGAVDSGGVHSNSGVNNKAAYLMTDGDTFNGYTISGLGVAKVGWIYYITNAYLLTSGSDYQDLGDALQAACASLVGAHGISAADCEQVRKAVLATEMDKTPANAATPEAPICADGQAPSDLFYDDMEDPASDNWASSATIGSNGWVYPEGSYAASGKYEIWGYNWPSVADYQIGMTHSITVPSGAYLRFRQAHGFQYTTAARDGGVVEYSTNDGASWNDAGALFTANGYNVTLNSASNPLNGRMAFGGVSKGYYSSRANLGALAGQNVRFRFRIGTDNAGNDIGWFIDDVRIYTCTAGNTAPQISAAGRVSVVQGDPAVTAKVGTVADAQDVASGLAITATSLPVGMAVQLTNSAGAIIATVSASCAVAPGAYIITLTATDSGELAASRALSVDVLPAGHLVRDSGLEFGSPNRYWEEGSTNFGTPLCDPGTCGIGGGSAGPRSGSWWAWFGGISNMAEDGSIAQTMYLPTGSATLEFYLWIGQHNSTGGASYVRALIDDTEIFRATDASTAYDGSYTKVSVDVSAFGGGARTLRFEGHNPSAPGLFNANLDDITLVTGNNACTTPLSASFSAASQRVAESAGHARTQVSLSRRATQDVSVPFTVSGTADGGGVDYELASGAITIFAGDQSANIDLMIVDDALDEADETVVVTMGAPSNATLGTPTAQTITIQDDDRAPALALSQGIVRADVDEGAGTLSMVVALSAASGRPVTVHYATGDGTATAGSDYTARSGSLTFSPGATSQTIVVPIVDDTTSEPDETFTLTLSAPGNATLGAPASTTVTIRDNDRGYKGYLPLIRRP